MPIEMKRRWYFRRGRGPMGGMTVLQPSVPGRAADDPSSGLRLRYTGNPMKQPTRTTAVAQLGDCRTASGLRPQPWLSDDFCQCVNDERHLGFRHLSEQRQDDRAALRGRAELQSPRQAAAARS